MAEVTSMRNNALAYPVYGVPYVIVFPMLDADGDLVTGATTPDAEVSKNGDTFADCTNESTEIATNSGVYYLSLTGTEMSADIVTVIAKSATAGMKTTVITLYPKKLVTLHSGTVGANAADGTTIQLASGASTIDDFYNGCLVVGTLDSNVEARLIGDYVGSTLVCTVTGPNFVTTPDNNDTYVVYAIPESRSVDQSAVVGWVGTTLPSPDTAGYPKVTVKDGTGTGEIDTTSGGVLVSTLAAAAKADVNAEVVDALNVDTYAEPGQGAPGATITLAAKINYLYKAWRNKKTQTATTFSLFADDASTVDQKATVSDDATTATVGEIATGP